jgi:hypothetical protein
MLLPLQVLAANLPLALWRVLWLNASGATPEHRVSGDASTNSKDIVLSSLSSVSS